MGVYAWEGLHPRRIGEGGVLMLAGVAAIAGGVLLSAAGPDAAAFATFLAVLGGAMVATGWWSRLFARLEMRLMDIEAALRQPDAATPKGGA